MKLLFTLMLLAAFAANATEFKIGTGSTTGNYYDMMGDVVEYCSDEMGDHTLSVMESGGSDDNISGMMNKRFALGVVQTDVLYYFKRKMPNKVNENSFGVLAGLHNEYVHILIPKGYKPESSGWGSWIPWGDDENQRLDLNLLQNQKVAAWGGSVLSAKALSSYMNLNLNVIDVPPSARAKLNMPVVIVGGQDYQPVKDLLDTKRFDIVALDYAAIAQSASYYQQAAVTYKVNGKMKSVPTVSVQALLVGKSFRKKSRNQPMSDLATCINEYSADLADDYETNPNWVTVYDFIEQGGQTAWRMFPLNEME